MSYRNKGDADNWNSILYLVLFKELARISHLSMALEGLDTSFVLVIPDLNLSIVGTADQVGLVSTVIVVDAVDALLVSVKSEIRGVWSQLPHLE